MAARFNKVDIPVEVERIGVDTFLIPSDVIARCGYTYLCPVYELLEDGMESLPHQNVGEYITKESLKSVASIAEEATIVLNVQVGKGKTQACYDLINEYSKGDKKVVLMVSPFKKLVEKDFTALTALGVSAFNYMQLPKDDTYDEVLADALKSKAHIMTINCLLGNPGEDSFAQTFVKSNYLNSLYAKCKEEGKEVIIFFDEIHESVSHFAAHLFPNLYRWADVVKQCYVSSATYTIALYPVLKYIALLTNKTIIEFHVHRHKWVANKISKLHLHILTEEYSGGRLHALAPLLSILKENSGKQVNILTAHKSIVKSLLQPKDSKGNDNPFYDVLKPFKFNEVHGGTDNSFNERGNNIGTTFKTGVNIDNSKSVLIIILPVVKQNSPENIFSDGAPSVIQALARQRLGGTIHILMYDPVYLLEPALENVEETDENGLGGYTFFGTYKPMQQRLDGLLTANKKLEYYVDQHRSLDILAKKYKTRYEKNGELINALRQSEADGTTQLGFQYPTFEQYLMDEGVHLLVKNYPQFGGDLSSYVLWAALNSQFVNAELKSISYYTENSRDIRLISKVFKTSLIKALPDGLIDKLKRASLKTVKEVIDKEIETSTWISLDGDKEVAHNKIHKFSIDGAPITYGKLITDSRYLTALIDITADVNGVRYAANEVKRQYITQNMAAALSIVTEKTTPIIALWKNLYDVQVAYLDYCTTCLTSNNNNKPIISVDAKDNMPMEIAQAMKAVVIGLRELDVFIGGKAISLGQRIESKDDDKLQTFVYNELRDLFTNITDDRTGSGKEKNQFFKIDGTLEKPLPDKPILKTF